MDASVMKRKPLGNTCDRAGAGRLGQTFTHDANESLSFALQRLNEEE